MVALLASAKPLPTTLTPMVGLVASAKRLGRQHAEYRACVCRGLDIGKEDLGEHEHGFEAWRRVIVPLKPRTDAKRNSLHSRVHNPPRATSLADIANKLEDWEEFVEEFGTCGGEVSGRDRMTVVMKLLPTTPPSNLVMGLR